MGRIVYSPRYDIGFFGLQRLHPADTRKHSRAWKLLRAHFGRGLLDSLVRPKRAVKHEELLAVHEADYLDSLRRPSAVAAALEMPVLRRAPWRVIDWCILRPMRWAAMGSVTAAREAIEDGFAVNLSGGYHHAKPYGGEGFCIYSDIALAVDALRRDRLIAADQRVVYVDLDAHQGNGVCHFFREDDRVFIFDMYNGQIYPVGDIEARRRIDCDVPLNGACSGDEYMRLLRDRLPPFLDSVGQSASVGIAVYNAGTDVFAGDPLGGLALSAEAIVERDVFVVEQLRRRSIPVVMLLSGGYTQMSHRLVADSLQRLLD